MHAFLGSDTTSHILDLNKNRFMKVAPNLWFDEAVLFNDRQVDKKDISEASSDDARIKSLHTKVSGTVAVALKCSTYSSCLPATFFEGLYKSARMDG